MHGENVFLSVVIPAYNEERRLAATVQRLVDYLNQQRWNWEVRVVDDGSLDATASIGEAFQRRDCRVVVQREPHRGKGAAVRSGLLAARGRYRFMCDADLSMPPHELARFLPPALDRVDVAIGTREGQQARRIGEPLYRHLMGRAFNALVQSIVVPGVEDTQCGFKMFTAAAAETIFPKVETTGWSFDIEVLAIARHYRLSIVEVPIEWHYEPDSRLLLLSDGVAMLGDLFRIRRRLKQLSDAGAR